MSNAESNRAERHGRTVNAPLCVKSFAWSRYHRVRFVLGLLRSVRDGLLPAAIMLVAVALLPLLLLVHLLRRFLLLR